MFCGFLVQLPVTVTYFNTTWVLLRMPAIERVWLMLTDNAKEFGPMSSAGFSN